MTPPKCRSGPRSCDIGWVNLEEGGESRELRENAERWIRGQGIVSPVRWAGMYAPGFALISKTPVETTF